MMTKDVSLLELFQRKTKPTGSENFGLELTK
jgi:hypothetical protein